MKISEISYSSNIALVTLPRVPSDSRIVGEILTAIASSGVNVDMISQSAPQGAQISLAFSISMDSLALLLPCINHLKASYPALSCEITVGVSKINFYDADMVNTPGVAAYVFTMLNSIQTVMITTSTVDISILVRDHDLDEVLKRSRTQLGVEPEEKPFE